MKNEIERWTVIHEYDDYEVSNHGRVKNSTTGKMLKLGKNKHGYQLVSLNKNGNYKTLRVHRLVAGAFLDNTHNKPCIDHIDGVRDNNNLCNLRYASCAENTYNKNVVDKRNTSGYTGVNWHSYEKKWKARIKHKGNDIEIGLYDTIEDAIKARCKKAIELFGDFANKADKESYMKYFM